MTAPPPALRCLLDQARKSGRLIETHISWVLLGETKVYKIKKPVDLGFLNFSTREQRLAACQSELTLNARLAPTTYLGVVPIRDDGGSAVVGDDQRQDLPLLDHAVEMRRLSDDGRADSLLQRGKLGTHHIDHLARLLSDFHARCKSDAEHAHYGSPDAIQSNIEENFEQTRDLLPLYLDPKDAKRIEDHQREFLARNTELFLERIAENKVRDGHGDLRLEHVYFESQGVQIIDCIEFNEAFRYGDVCADLAFLVMDLRHQDRSDLAERLLAKYAEQSGDFGLYRLIDFYEGYRAFIRGKVRALLEEQKKETGSEDAHFHRETRRYFSQAEASLEATFVPPRIYAVGGLIASGKSTLARQLSSRLNCPILDSDSCRKRLAGISPLTPATSEPFSGLYRPEMTEKVHERLFEQAGWVLDSGRSVILDATFRRSSTRERLRDLACDKDVALRFLWCEADEETTLRRLAEREETAGISDGRVDILRTLVRDTEPPTLDEFDDFQRFDTTQSTQNLGARLETYLNDD